MDTRIQSYPFSVEYITLFNTYSSSSFTISYLASTTAFSNFDCEQQRNYFKLNTLHVTI